MGRNLLTIDLIKEDLEALSKIMRFVSKRSFVGSRDLTKAEERKVIKI